MAIVKNLTRKGGTSQLFAYLFKYTLNEEKVKTMPDLLRPYLEKVQEYDTAKDFENALNDEGLLQYGIKDESSIATTDEVHLTTDLHAAKERAGKKEPVKKYVLSPYAKLFNLGSDEQAPEVSTIDVPTSEQLKNDGFAGITAPPETVIFNRESVAELPKDFFKQGKLHVEHAKYGNTMREKPLVIRHNVRSRSVKSYAAEFQRNEANRIHKAKNSISIHHTIISFSSKDKELVTDLVLKDMAKKYIELRGKDIMYVITPHYDKDHIHLHCSMSATRLNGYSSSISRKKFAEIKKELDAYQKEKYPELLHSLPRHGRANQIEAREEYKNIKRDERASDRNTLLLLLDESFSKATSQEQFFSVLKALGHEPYYRSGKLTGIIYNGERKFRLNRLGYDEKKLEVELNLALLIRYLWLIPRIENIFDLLSMN